MSETKQERNSFDPKAASIFGVLLAFSGYLFFGGVYLLASIFDFSFQEFIQGLKIIAVYSSFYGYSVQYLGRYWPLGINRGIFSKRGY